MDRWSVVLAVLVAVLLGAVAFVPARDNAFVYDDLPIIVENPSVTRPGAWHRFWHEPYWPRARSADTLYRPLTVWSFRANTVLAGGDAPNPWAFRLVNIALHALTSAGVVILAYRLTGRAAAAWIAGALFAAHPLHTEAVVTAYGRSDLLVGLFGVWLLVRHVRGPDGSGRRSLRFHLVSSSMLLAAIMSKEHAVFLWPVILLIDVWHRRQTAPQARPRFREWLNRTLGPSHVGFMLTCATFFVLRFALFGWRYRLDPARTRIWESPLAHAGWLEHLLTPFRLLWLSLELCVWPGRLCPIWSIPALPLADHLAWDVAAGMILLVALVVLVAALWHRRSPVGALVAGMLMVLAIPVQALPLAHWLFGERWLYLPTVFVAVLVGAGLTRLGRAAGAAAVAAAVVLLPATWSYTGAFADNLTMARQTVLRQPDNFQGRRFLAGMLYSYGQYAAAVHAANELLDRFGPVRDAYVLLLQSYLELGDGRRALEALAGYNATSRHIPHPALAVERKRAEALIEQQHRRHATSVPAWGPEVDQSHIIREFIHHGDTETRRARKQ